MSALPLDLMREATVLLFGEPSARQLARALGPLHPDGPRDQVDDRLVRRWAAGHREIPPWALTGMAFLLDRGRLEMEAEYRKMSAASANLKVAADSSITYP